MMHMILGIIITVLCIGWIVVGSRVRDDLRRLRKP